MRLAFFQFGDFGEAYRRFQDGLPETFRDQRASVDFVASLQSQYEVTTVATCAREHREEFGPRLRSIGITVKPAYSRSFIDGLMDDIAPDIMVCRTPNYYAIRWAKQNRVPTLLSFANFFSNRGPKDFVKNMRLRALFDRSVFPCVANHSLNAALSVSKALFYPESRIVPWDWTRLVPEKQPKTSFRNPARPLAFYAGNMLRTKGVGDCLDALALLRSRGVDLTFVFAGPGDLAPWRKQAADLGVSEHAQFLGRIPNQDVRQRMNESDVVVVASHHEYAEGLPNTLYEALASRTPAIVSDHPAFASRLRDGENCLIFKAADSASLADRFQALLSDPALYGRVSEGAAAAHDSLYIGMEWPDLVTVFLGDPSNRSGWVEANSLVQLRAKGQMPGR